MTVSGSCRIIHYWCGCPQSPNSRWQRSLRLVRACAERGWRNVLVWSSLPEDPALVTPFREAGCAIMLQPRPAGNFDRRSVLRCYRLVRDVNCTIFHCHNVHTSPLIGAALARTPVRIWSKLSMSDDYEAGRQPSGIHRLQPSTRVSVRLAHRVLCLSEAVREEAGRAIGRSEKLEVLAAPVDLERFVPASGQNARAELGIAPTVRVVTAVGRAVEVKGWDTLIEAYARVAVAAPDSVLLLVGSITHSTEVGFARRLQDRVEALGLHERVQFLGKRDDIPRVLAASDCFVFPSRSEGQGLALVEALACGLPCIAARVGGIPEVITHDDNGLLVDREDAEGLAESIIRLLHDPALSASLRQRARLSAQRYDLEAWTVKQMEIYDRLLRRKAPAMADRLIDHAAPAPHCERPLTQWTPT